MSIRWSSSRTWYGDDVVEPAGLVEPHPVGEVAAVGELHAQERVARLHERQVRGAVGLRAGVRLDVDVVAAEHLLGALDRQLLGDVDPLAAAVVAAAGVALGVLVREHRALALEDRLGHEVLRGDHLQRALLALELVREDVRNLRIDVGKRAVEEVGRKVDGHGSTVLGSTAMGRRIALTVLALLVLVPAAAWALAGGATGSGGGGGGGGGFSSGGGGGYSSGGGGERADHLGRPAGRLRIRVHRLRHPVRGPHSAVRVAAVARPEPGFQGTLKADPGGARAGPRPRRAKAAQADDGYWDPMTSSSASARPSTPSSRPGRSATSPPSRPYVSEALYQRHELQLEGLERQHRVNRIADLQLDRVDIVRVVNVTDDNQDRFVAFVECRARDWMEDTETGKVVNGNPQSQTTLPAVLVVLARPAPRLGARRDPAGRGGRLPHGRQGHRYRRWACSAGCSGVSPTPSGAARTSPARLEALAQLDRQVVDRGAAPTGARRVLRGRALVDRARPVGRRAVHGVAARGVAAPAHRGPRAPASRPSAREPADRGPRLRRDATMTPPHVTALLDMSMVEMILDDPTGRLVAGRPGAKVRRRQYWTFDWRTTRWVLADVEQPDAGARHLNAPLVGGDFASLSPEMILRERYARGRDRDRAVRDRDGRAPASARSTN